MFIKNGWNRALHGEMAYLGDPAAVHKRTDPRQVLAECQSILVLGIPYFHAQSDDLAFNSERSSLNVPGRVAAYAWGEDYHEALPPRLRALVAFIEEQVGESIPNRWYTDTGPLLERELAQRAGLGWIGKNTCLIHPRAGSYFLLAEILLGVALEPDPPFPADHCGACTRCIEACPTACILPERTLDARRCISYLTIELKGSIPSELRPSLGDWVFGCDICQQVCPWNLRFAPAQGDPAFAPRPDVPRPELLGDLSLSPEAFNKKFKGSPVKRAKRRGYLRNLAVASGNNYAGTGVIPVVEALSTILQTEVEPLVRQHAAWALGRVGGHAARQALLQAEQTETDSGVLHEIQLTLNI